MEYTWTLSEENAEEGDRHGSALRPTEGRNDFVGGIDNEALDFSQLEDFINDESENGNAYFVDTLSHNESNRIQPSETTVLVVETHADEDVQQHRGSRLTLQPSGVITNATFTPSHNLPESPPDSGSEPPYSPQQEAGGKNSPHQKHPSRVISQQEILLHPSHTTLFPQVSLKPPQVHPVPPSHVQCEPMLIQHSVLTPLLTANPSILSSTSNSNNNGNNSNNTNTRTDSLLLGRDITTSSLSTNRDTILLTRNDTTILLNSDSQILNSDRGLNSDGQLSNKNQLINSSNSLLTSGSVLNSNLGNSVLLNQNNHSPLMHSPSNGTLMSQSPQRSSPALNATNGAQNSGSLLQQRDGSISNMYSTLQSGSKKRKLSQDLSSSGNGPILYVKQEKPDANVELSPDSNSNHTGMLDEEYNIDGNAYSDSAYQCIRFQPFQQSQWHVLCDQNLKELPAPHYRVDADKGFNFSNADDAFVCQKKNHFQITCHTQLLGDAQFVKTPEGLKKISSFYLHFYGVKVESSSQTIKVEQSQSDRSKKPFHPVLVELQSEQVTKVTVGRLHFSETTSNNMRKKGKPNPDQRYFYLVVGLHAHTCDSNYPVVSHASERIIVRASNPGQFESDVELCWQKGHTPESIFHAGKVGINTDRPDESLVVHGNLKVTGHIVQPSDLRAKFEVEECNTRVQLKNIEQIRVVKYRYATEFAEEVGIKEDTGVIAQEVQKILPDAVRRSGDVTLPSGEIIENFLVVNKERIFMENIGAVKELCKVTDHLGKRIEQVEKMNRRLAKLKKLDSFKSNSTSSTVVGKIPSLEFITGKEGKTLDGNQIYPNYKFCSNKTIQVSMAFIVIMLALCLTAMATLYFLEIQNKNTIIKRESGMNRRFYTSAIGTLNTINKTYTSSKEHFNKDKSKITTKLAPFFSYSKELVKKEASSEKVAIESSPLPPPKTFPVLGRPPDCGNSGPNNFYGDADSNTCQTYCCFLDSSHSSEEKAEILNSAKLIVAQEIPLDDQSLSFLPRSKNSEDVENPPPTGTNTIDQGKKINFDKDMSQRSKLLKKSSKINTEKLNQHLARHKRDPDDLNEENSNLELPNGPKYEILLRLDNDKPCRIVPKDNGWKSPLNSWWGTGNGISVTVSAANVSQTLGPEFCAFSNKEYTHCVDSNAVNSTYHIPLSKYMPDDYVIVQFQLKQHRSVKPCQKVIPQTDFLCQKRTSSSLDLIDSGNVFYVEISNYWSIAVKFRVPLNHTDTLSNVCDQKDGLGIIYLEYNLIFYRDCEY